MPYISRDSNSIIRGDYRVPQSTNQEFIDDKDQEYVSYKSRINKSPKPRSELAQESIDRDAAIGGIVSLLAAKFSMTRAEVVAEIRSRA